MIRKSCSITIAIVTGCLIAADSSAGPDFFEDSVGEAGSTPGTAMTPNGSGTLNRIHGEVEGAGAGPMPPDFEDMYLIDITDPIAFRATTVEPNGSATFNTMLWLFSADMKPEGQGRLGNDDAPPQPNGIEGGPTTGSLLLPMATDPTMQTISAGLHYVAISGFPNDPTAMGLPIFFLAVPIEISGPDGPGGPFPIEDWNGVGEIGEYIIYFEGVSFPPQPCPADLDGSGDITFGDLLVLLSEWGLCAPGSDCIADLDGSGEVGFADLLILLAAWGPCPT